MKKYPQGTPYRCKIITIFLLIIVLMMGVTGCMLFNKSSRGDDMLIYMKEKYGEEFLFVEPFGGKLGSKSTQIVASCNKFPGEEILIMRTEQEDGEYVYSDNYTSFLLKDELTSLLSNIATEVYGDNNKVIYKVSKMTLPPSYDQNTTLKEYTSGGQGLISIFVLLGSTIDVKDKDVDVESFRLLLKKNSILASAGIYYTNDEALQNINKDNIQKYYQDPDWNYANGDFNLNASYEFSYMDWR